MSAEDSVYEKQICEANKLGNALLSGLIAEGIAENKRNIKLSGALINLRDLVENYKNEVQKLKSLQIGSCYDVLELRKNYNSQAQIVLSGEMLKKIEGILKLHVKHNESKVISKGEIKALQSQMSLINSMQGELERLPESQDILKEHLKIIDAIKANLELITSTTRSANSKIEGLQQDIISHSSNVLYYSI